MREERRRLREPPLGGRGHRALAARHGEVEIEMRLRRAGRQRGEGIARGGGVRGLATEVDETAAVGMLQRMQQRGMPAGKQRYDKENPRETGDHFTSLGPRR